MFSPSPETISANTAAIRQTIQSTCARCGRSPDEITIIPVTKTVDAQAVRILAKLGFDTFGENRLQPSEPKIESLGDLDIRWHFIGHLQSRKIRPVMNLFACIQSVDSFRLASKINTAVEEAAPPFPILLEANISGETAKYGFSPDELKSNAESLAEMSGLRIEGLMTMAPFTNDPDVIRRTFAGLRELRDELSGLFVGSDTAHLSMGMTNDYELAIEEGATILRIGSAFFAEPTA